MEEVIKRARSIDLQLAAILTQNSSNLSINQVGLEENNTTKYASNFCPFFFYVSFS